jgi:glycosyltransferase involved in cell wall biosynthesis
MVSVIIPAYMSGKYLYEALDSALIQDVEMEILVIDDCPGDDTPDKLVQYIESRYTGKFTDKTTHGKKNKVHQDDGLCQKVLKKTRLRAECLVGDVRIRIYQNRANLGVAVVRNIGTA